MFVLQTTVTILDDVYERKQLTIYSPHLISDERGRETIADRDEFVIYTPHAGLGGHERESQAPRSQDDRMQGLNSISSASRRREI